MGKKILDAGGQSLPLAIGCLCTQSFLFRFYSETIDYVHLRECWLISFHYICLANYRYPGLSAAGT